MALRPVHRGYGKTHFNLFSPVVQVKSADQQVSGDGHLVGDLDRGARQEGVTCRRIERPALQRRGPAIDAECDGDAQAGAGRGSRGVVGHGLGDLSRGVTLYVTVKVSLQAGAVMAKAPPSSGLERSPVGWRHSGPLHLMPSERRSSLPPRWPACFPSW